MGNKARDSIFDGIHKKINKNPLEWNEEAGFYEATVTLSKREKDTLFNRYENFFEDNSSLAGWGSNSDGGTSFYFSYGDSDDDYDYEDN